MKDGCSEKASGSAAPTTTPPALKVSPFSPRGGKGLGPQTLGGSVSSNESKVTYYKSNNLKWSFENLFEIIY